MIAKIAQLAEHVIGNDEVPGSIPGLGFCPRPAPYEIVKQFLYGAQKSASPFSSVAEQWFRPPAIAICQRSSVVEQSLRKGKVAGSNPSAGSGKWRAGKPQTSVRF